MSAKAPSAADPSAPLTWEADLRLLTSPPMLSQFGTVVGVSGLIMALLLGFLMAVQGEWDQIGVMVLISAGAALFLGVLMALVSLVVFGNRIRLRHTLDARGLLTETVDRRARAGSRLALWLGALAGSPATAGAGMLALSRENERVSWRGIAAARYHPGSRTISLHNRWRMVALVACTAENYATVAEAVATRVAAAERKRAGRAGSRVGSPVPRLLGRTALAVLASAPVFALPYPFELDIFLPLLMLCFALATIWLVPLFGWVVMVLAAALVAQIVFIGLETKQSMFQSVGTYQNFEVLDGADWAALLVAAVGLAYLVITAWRAVHGRVPSALSADAEEMDD